MWVLYIVWMCTVNQNKSEKPSSLFVYNDCWLSFLKNIWFCGFSVALCYFYAKSYVSVLIIQFYWRGCCCKPCRLPMRSQRLWPRLLPWRVNLFILYIFLSCIFLGHMKIIRGCCTSSFKNLDRMNFSMCSTGCKKQAFGKIINHTCLRIRVRQFIFLKRRKKW